jgi:hypothetical protein
MTALSFRALALKRESGERDLEKRVRSFWKGLGSNMTPPVYGADTPGRSGSGCRTFHLYPRESTFNSLFLPGGNDARAASLMSKKAAVKMDGT